MAQNSRSLKEKQRRLRDELSGVDVDCVAAEMMRQFGLRPRAGYRAALGLTQDAAADRYNRAAAAAGLDAGGAATMDGSRIANFEAWPTGGRRPTLPVLRVLAATYGTDMRNLVDVYDRRAMPREDLLVLRGMDRPAQTPAPPAAAAPGGAGAQLLIPEGSAGHGSPAPELTGAAGLGGADLAYLQATRRLVDGTLATGTVTRSQLDQLTDRLTDYREHYTVTSPAAVLPQLLADVVEAQSIAADRQPGLIQVRLSETIALLAALVADALMKLGAIHEAAGWHRTARAAAQDAGNTELHARMLVQAAMLPYYFGAPAHARRLAREARTLLAGAVSPVAASAAAAEARAAARGGDVRGARAALDDAYRLFEATRTCSGAAAPDAFGFPERRLLLYASGTLTYLGDDAAARSAQTAAEALYPPGSGIDPAFLQLDEALRYVRQHALTDAGQLVIAAIDGVPPGHRTPILKARAAAVVDEVPVALRSTPAIAELRELLALPAGTTT